MDFFGDGSGGTALRIARVRTADGTPIMFEDNLFQAERYAFLAELDLRDVSIFDAIKQRIGLVPSKSLNGFDLNIDRADSDLASLLDVSKNEPLFYVHGRYVDQNGRPMFFGKQYMVGKRYSFRL